MRRRRQRRGVGSVAKALTLALVATLVAVTAPDGPVPSLPPAAADGNEAPGAPAAARSISAGTDHTCALLPSGRVKCWGSNGSGRLGYGDTVSRGDQPGEMQDLAAVDLGTGRTATAISAGSAYTCALLDNATVKCWGTGANGRLGQGSTSSLGDQPGEMGDALPAVDLGSGRTATAISAGNLHTCALLDNATVKCWGTGANGRLGQDSTTTLGDAAGELGDSLPAVDLGAGRTATAVSAGNNHTCALLDNATVKCWGANGSGQLGQDSTTPLGDEAGEMAALGSVNLGAGRTATAISAGTADTCALLDNATVKCWGANGNGQLGQDSTTPLGDTAGEMAALAAVNLGAGRTATAISAGAGHTCALLDNASVKCWGNGTNGQLGQDSTTPLGDTAGEMAALSAVDLGAGRTAIAVTTGDGHTCAQLDDGTVKCWGRGNVGQLGQESTTDLGDAAGEMAALDPIDLGGPMVVELTTPARWVAPGNVIDYELTIVNESLNTFSGITVSDTDAPDCAGPIANLASGDTHTIECSLPTTALDFGSTVDHTATVDTDQTAATPSPSVTVVVAHPYTVGDLAGASSHTCAVVDTGELVCFGSNGLGTLGLGNTTPLGDQVGDLLLPPTVDLGTGRTATSVATGGAHSCAVLDGGEVKCWGVGSSGRTGYGNEDIIGDGAGEMGDALPAVDLGTGRTATTVAAGSMAASTCALLDNGSLKCWGINFGQLGAGHSDAIGDQPGEMGDALPAIDLGTGRTAAAIATGSTHTCAVLDNGAVKCWGSGGVGALGNGSNATIGDEPGEMGDELPPVDLGTGRTATAIAAGSGHTCAVLDNGAAKCWGYDSYGQLGQGGTANIGDQPGEMGDALPAVNLGTGRTATAITAGQNHTCALLDNGAIKCWGYGFQGQIAHGATTSLGDGPGEMGDALLPIDIGAGRTATTVIAGQAYTCAVLDDGRLKCWGEGGAKLGQGPVGSIGDEPGEMAALEPIELIGSPGPPILDVEVAVTPPAVLAGQAFDVDVTVTNAGLVSATDITVEVPDAPDCDDTIAALGPGEDEVIECNRTTSPADVGPYEVVATVDSAQTAPAVSDAAVVQVELAAISGRVTDAGTGDPIAAAWVVAITSTGVLSQGGLTDSNGDYELALPAGSYKVEFVDPTGRHLGEWHDDAPLGDFDAATPVAIADLDPVTLDAALTPWGDSGAIAGTVVRTGTSTPIAGAWVIGVRVSDGAIAGVLSDANGDYRVEGLPAGTYRLAVVDPSLAHSYDLFFDDKPSFFTGDDIIVTAGTTTTVDPDLDPATPPSPDATITGTLTDEVSGQPLDGVWAMAVQANTGVFSAATQTNASGQYSLAVPAGPYKVEYVDPSAAHTGEWFHNAHLGDFGSATIVNVAAFGNAVVHEALAPTTGTIAGTVTETGGSAPIEGVWVLALRSADAAMIGWATTAADGTYAIEGLSAGNHRLVVLDPQHRYELELFWQDRADFSTGDDIAVTGGGTVTIDPDLDIA